MTSADLDDEFAAMLADLLRTVGEAAWWRWTPRAG
jgi:hypothetical protein